VALHWHPLSVSRSGHDADDRDSGERKPDVNLLDVTAIAAQKMLDTKHDGDFLRNSNLC
jgi:hypothetical protein